MKNTIMLIAAFAAIGCCVISLLDKMYLVAILSLFSSFLPIAVWKIDSKDSKKTEEKMKKEIDNQKAEIEEHKSKIAQLEDNITWKEL